MAGKIDSIDQRVAANERALAAKRGNNISTLVMSSSNQAVSPVPSQPIACAGGSADQAIVPSVDYLKQNPLIQAHVDRRIQELHQLNE